MKDKQEAIRRWCELQHRVSRDIHEYHRAADCFCGFREKRDGYESKYWRNEGAALEFVERLVDAHLRRHRIKRWAMSVVRNATDSALARVERRLGLDPKESW